MKKFIFIVVISMYGFILSHDQIEEDIGIILFQNLQSQDTSDIDSIFISKSMFLKEIKKLTIDTLKRARYNNYFENNWESIMAPIILNSKKNFVELKNYAKKNGIILQNCIYIKFDYGKLVNIYGIKGFEFGKLWFRYKGEQYYIDGISIIELNGKWYISELQSKRFWAVAKNK